MSTGQNQDRTVPVTVQPGAQFLINQRVPANILNLQFPSSNSVTGIRERVERGFSNLPTNPLHPNPHVNKTFPRDQYRAGLRQMIDEYSTMSARATAAALLGGFSLTDVKGSFNFENCEQVNICITLGREIPTSIDLKRSVLEKFPSDFLQVARNWGREEVDVSLVIGGVTVKTKFTKAELALMDDRVKFEKVINQARKQNPNLLTQVNSQQIQQALKKASDQAKRDYEKLGLGVTLEGVVNNIKQIVENSIWMHLDRRTLGRRQSILDIFSNQNPIFVEFVRSYPTSVVRLPDTKLSGEFESLSKNFGEDALRALRNNREKDLLYVTATLVVGRLATIVENNPQKYESRQPFLTRILRGFISEYGKYVEKMRNASNSRVAGFYEWLYKNHGEMCLNIFSSIFVPGIIVEDGASKRTLFGAQDSAGTTTLLFSYAGGNPIENQIQSCVIRSSTTPRIDYLNNWAKGAPVVFRGQQGVPNLMNHPFYHVIVKQAAGFAGSIHTHADHNKPKVGPVMVNNDPSIVQPTSQDPEGLRVLINTPLSSIVPAQGLSQFASDLANAAERIISEDYLDQQGRPTTVTILNQSLTLLDLLGLPRNMQSLPRFSVKYFLQGYRL